MTLKGSLKKYLPTLGYFGLAVLVAAVIAAFNASKAGMNFGEYLMARLKGLFTLK